MLSAGAGRSKTSPERAGERSIKARPRAIERAHRPRFEHVRRACDHRSWEEWVNTGLC